MRGGGGAMRILFESFGIVLRGAGGRRGLRRDEIRSGREIVGNEGAGGIGLKLLACLLEFTHGRVHSKAQWSKSCEMR